MKHTCRTKRQTAFTLIEMMIVLLIIAVLSTFAYPSYRQAKLKTARAEGRAALMRLMQQQEGYYTGHQRYLHFKADSAESTGSAEAGTNDGSAQAAAFLKRFSGETAATSAYFLEARACESGSGFGQSDGDRHCVLLRAIPANGLDDPACGILTLDSAGRQEAAGDGGNACR